MTKAWIITIILVLLVITALFYIGKHYFTPIEYKDPIKVGIVHSLSGTMSISESPVVDATLMAIHEINENGGVINRLIQPIILDGHSNDTIFAENVKKLILDQKVDVIFGCWTSSCRKSIQPIVEQYHSLFIYPVQYEGLEQSPNIIYLGAAPNQQIIPAINWSFEHLGKKFFLVGSDYIFPHTANAIIKDQVKTLSGEILGEEYIPLGTTEVAPIIKKILETNPDVIINTLNGDSNIEFFRGLKNANINADKLPVMSFSISENEVRTIGVDLLVGHYAAWNYFQSIESKANQKFVKNFQNRYGAHRTTSDPMEAAYIGVYLWAQAVNDAKSSAPNDVLNAITKQNFSGPEGVVSVDANTGHVWKTLRIGKLNKEGQFDIVWSSETPIEPVPYPTYRSKSDWDLFLKSLYEKWGNHWSNQNTKKPDK